MMNMPALVQFVLLLSFVTSITSPGAPPLSAFGKWYALCMNELVLLVIRRRAYGSGAYGVAQPIESVAGS